MMCGKEITNKLHLSYLKYLSLATASLAVIIPTVLNIVGVFPVTPLVSAINNTNQSTTTSPSPSVERADERSSSGEGTLSLSLSPNTNSDTNGNINLTIPTGGGVVNGSHTINYTISNIPTGLVSTTYNLTLSSKTSNTDMLLLDPVTSTVKNKLPTITP
ncbi:MAG: hypothetical protein Q4C83_03045, partial [Candidatus Saccharibacteria bacterium]|nr:hypothetical protein [Candidatus Saccharibacteria bacterium]